MARLSTALLAAAFLFASFDAALAQSVWPSMPTEALGRGPGFYFAIYKLVLLLIPFLLWVKTADWLGRDVAIHSAKTGLKPEVWNPLYVFVFFFTFLLLGISFPFFIVGYLAVLLAYAVPLGVYVVQRNAKVAPDDRVFTADHLKKWFANLGKRKKATKERRRAPYEYGAPVDYTPRSGDKTTDQANLIAARQSPAYIPAKELIADALNRRTEKILLDYTADAVAVKYMIDGVWHAAAPKVHEKDPLNRELGDAILAVHKKLCNLNPADRRSRQEGKMQISYLGNKLDTTLASQGTPTGERVLITMLPVVKTAPGLEELGMREPHRERLKELLTERGNMVVFSSMPGDGLSATWVAALKASDRYMRDYVTLQDIAKPEPDVENVDSAPKFNAAAGETPMSVFAKVALKQPEVFCVPEIADSATLNALVSQVVDEERKALVSVRAKEAVEAILRLLMLKPDVPNFTKALGAVVNQRLVRTLCDQCKEPFQPPPEVLQRLGIPAGKVQVLYREKQPLPPGVEPPKRKKGDPPEICPKCQGIGYYGRTAIFELLVVDDRLREAIAKQPKIEVLRQVSRQAGNWSLQEEGVLLLAQGVTSFTELQRVLKA